MCARVVRTFLRCASLLPSLSEGGKLKLAADVGQLEAVLHSIAAKRRAEMMELLRFKDMLFASQRQQTFVVLLC